ncbi:hypothetical protein NDU88_003386 [Pleurodeles waltl]|uniref:Uncharacterized protein n=1 Tax=Pleurodeles waltl TaxID=8319 RepID=A0AAV7NQR9_PLEWA|nr:hypothetical protein NDU88_003386 [Pleurodeles waltl]
MRGTAARARLAERSWWVGVWKGGWPPGVVPCGVVGAEDEDLCLVRVKFEVALLHPGGDGVQSVVQVGFGGGEVLGGFGGPKQEGKKADSLRSAGEEGGDPGKCFVADPCIIEESAEGVVADGVKSSQEAQEDEGRGFALVEHGPDVVGCGDEDVLGAVVPSES